MRATETVAKSETARIGGPGLAIDLWREITGHQREIVMDGRIAQGERSRMSDIEETTQGGQTTLDPTTPGGQTTLDQIAARLIAEGTGQDLHLAVVARMPGGRMSM